MILDKKPLALVEVKSLIKGLEEKKQMESYIKKFSKISKADAEKLAAEIRALNNPKINEENLVKILDFLPANSEELNKIFIEVSLSEEEANSILEIIKKY